MKDFLLDKPKRGPIPVFSNLLKRHEILGITSAVNGRIPIKKEEKKKTLIHLKLFLTSMGGTSKEAREFFKRNYIIIDK